MIRWSFPLNNGGQMQGGADAGIETFNGDELSSLAREICQNSLDANDNNEKPTQVEFYNHFTETKCIPGYDEMKLSLIKCKEYWATKNSERAKKFLNTASKQVLEKNMFVMRISDYNTTGLSMPYSTKYEGEWNSLVKIDGGSCKTGDSGGSYGVGKKAPFSNSYFYMVFYRTLNKNKEAAAQGVIRLMSFPDDIENQVGTMRTGVGYYGEDNNNMPIKTINELDNLKKREQVGTDIFIYGFKSGKWEEQIIPEILYNFLISIFKDKLIVKIQNTEINSNSMKGIIGRYENTRKDISKYYYVLLGGDDVQEFTYDFHGLGKLILKLYFNQQEKLNRKVMVVRNSGMMIFEMSGISREIMFTGVLELEGIKLNAFFREMENMQHNKWEPKRHSDPEQAEKYSKEIKDWVKEVIRKTGIRNSNDEINVEGLSDILNLTDNDDIEKKKEENLNEHLGNIKIIEIKKKNNVPGQVMLLGGKGDTNNKSYDELGSVNEDGADLATRTLRGNRKRKSKVSHKGRLDSNGKDIIHVRKENGNKVVIKNVKIFKCNNEEYKLSMMVPNDIFAGHIDIIAIGEDGSKFNLMITDVKEPQGFTLKGINNGAIKFGDIISNNIVAFKFIIGTENNYAMGVNVYEDNE